MKCECAFESNIIGADKESRNSISSSLALLLKALIPLLFLASGSVGAQVGLPAISVSQTPDWT